MVKINIVAKILHIIFHSSLIRSAHLIVSTMMSTNSSLGITFPFLSSSSTAAPCMARLESWKSEKVFTHNLYYFSSKEKKTQFPQADQLFFISKYKDEECNTYCCITISTFILIFLCVVSLLL